MIRPPSAHQLALEFFAQEAEDARRADELGYYARVLAQVTMPHSDPGPVPAWGRRNGAVSPVMQPGFRIGRGGAPVSLGLPYGAAPRLIMAWLTTEAVRTRQRDLFPGETLSSFLGQLGLHRIGGPRGDITSPGCATRPGASSPPPFPAAIRARTAGWRVASESPPDPSSGGIRSSPTSLRCGDRRSPSPRSSSSRSSGVPSRSTSAPSEL